MRFGMNVFARYDNKLYIFEVCTLKLNVSI